MTHEPDVRPYHHPSGGWGSARSLGNILRREGVPLSGWLVLLRQNKPDGFQCVSCAWSKPASPLPFEFCENGAKATAWEITSHHATPALFAKHTVSELWTWEDHRLEQAGRLTEPLRSTAAVGNPNGRTSGCCRCSLQSRRSGFGQDQSRQSTSTEPAQL